MPTYAYRCRKGHTFELFHSITDDSPKRCPKCRSLARRVPAGGAGLLFKGSGFHVTDYRSASYKEKAKAERGGSGGAGQGGGGGGKDKGGASPGPKAPGGS